MKQEISVSRLKTYTSLMLLVVWMLFMVAIVWLARLFQPNRAKELLPIFHRGVLKCLNLNCIVEGIPITGRPTLYISNHISYFDIFVLGSVIPGTCIAKSEVAKWPLFGQLAKLQDTLFIERKSHKVGNQIQQIQKHLVNENNLVLFPEGTSSIGTYVAPFHSGLFQAAKSEQYDITIQPITIAYTHYKDEAMDRRTRDYYAWYKPRKIVPHFLNGLGLGRAQVKLICHEPVKFMSFESRKDLARYCETVVRQGLLQALDMDREVKPT